MALHHKITNHNNLSMILSDEELTTIICAVNSFENGKYTFDTIVNGYETGLIKSLETLQVNQWAVGLSFDSLTTTHRNSDTFICFEEEFSNMPNALQQADLYCLEMWGAKFNVLQFIYSDLFIHVDSN